MSQMKEGFFPLNDGGQDPNVRGESPKGMELHINVVAGSMTSGVKAFDVVSDFGKGSGELFGDGIILLGTVAATNKALTAKAAIASSAGKVTVTLESTDATETTDHTLSFFLIGRVLPQDA